MQRRKLLWTLLFLISVALPWGCGGCDDTESKGTSSGNNQATNNQTENNDPSTNNATQPDTGTPTPDAGWMSSDSGQVVVRDMEVIIDQDGGTFTCQVTACQEKVLECGDCIDNDEDGKVDWQDPECLGPCDNTEGPTLAAGIGGDTGGRCKVDCYFDFGNGPGNDDCHWDHRCDPLAVAPNFPPEGEDCAYDDRRVGSRDCPDEQSEQCLEYCRPLTPNGCDCFGCCTLPGLEGMGADGGDGYVWIGAMDPQKIATCTFADVNDPVACPPCTPVLDCWNDCGRCEVCVGRPIPPADCFDNPNVTVDDMGNTIDTGMPGDGGTDGGTTNDGQCPGGEQPCGLQGQDPCESNHYCISGCCQRIAT